MRITSIIFLLIILTLFAVGGSLKDSPEVDTIGIFDNATITIQNITLETDSSSPLANSVIEITEQYIHFIGTIIFEVSKFMITFGKDNPNYFEPSFLITIIKLIFILVIISLLIKPLFYLIILITLFVIWLDKKMKGGKEQHGNNKGRGKGV